MRRATGKLRIHRETLRTLSDAGLERVAGGTLGSGLVGVPLGLFGKDALDVPLPRSNGWTGGSDVNQPTC